MKNKRPMKNKFSTTGWPLSRKIFFGMSATSAAGICLAVLVTATVTFFSCMSLQTKATFRQLSYISDLLDFFLKTVDNYSRTIVIDPVVQDILSRGNLTEYDTIRLREEMEKVIQSTEFIHSAAIYDSGKERIVSTEIFNSNSTLRDSSFRENPVWLPRLKISPQDRQSTVPVISLFREFYDYNSGTPLGYLEISIPESAISNIYRDKNKKGSAFFITDAQGTIQSSDGSYPVFMRYRPFAEIPEDKGSGYRFFGSQMVFFESFPQLNWTIFSETPLVTFFEPIFMLILCAAFIAGGGILLSVFFSHRISKTVTAPVSKLIAHIQSVRDGDWVPMTLPAGSDEEIGFLMENFNEMIRAQVLLKDDLVREQKRKQELSLNLLQQQINPHFLYNTLDNICSLAELEETDTLVRITLSLSKFYRKALGKGSFFVTVADELAMTEAYLDIMRVRYFQRFDYIIECAPSLREYGCLKLLLQPVVENSIYHGIKEITRHGQILIRVSEEAKTICFEIVDNGAGLPEGEQILPHQQEAGGFGLENIQQRITLYYGPEYGVSIANHPPMGCRVTIRIGKKGPHSDSKEELENAVASSDRG